MTETAQTGERHNSNSEWSLRKRFLVALLLALPALTPYLSQWRHASSEGVTATGFIQYDMPYYMANARQYSDGDSSGLFYSNPFDHRGDSPKIYWQPLLLLLAGLIRLFPDSPGLIFDAVGLLFVVLALMHLPQLVVKLCPSATAFETTVLVVTLAWGGGFLAASGILWCYLKGVSLYLYVYDPGNGTWFLNLGRNFIYTTEAFYHYLVLSLLWSVLNHRKGMIALWAWLLILSHPFTGVQYALIVFSWVLFEKQFLNSGLYKWRDLFVMFTPLLYGVGYYLVFLPSHPSHAALAKFWAVDWSIKILTILFAYSLFGFLVLYRCRTSDRFLNCFADPFNRFLAVSFCVSFVLANHEAFFEPHQPVHFTRGHLWTPLCLLSLPLLQQLMEMMRPKQRLRQLAVAAWLSIVLFDNTAFFVNNWSHPGRFYLTDAARSAFRFIDEQRVNPILFSDDQDLAFLSACYSDARPYLGHHANTPQTYERAEMVNQFFEDGIVPPEIEQEPFLVLTTQHTEQVRKDARFKSVFQRDELELFEYSPPAMLVTTRFE